MKVKNKVTVDDLLEGCKRQERQSQELLYSLLSGKMFAVCMRYSRDREDAEDILQTGFIKVFRKVSEFKGEGSFEGWVRRIMVNTAIEEYRRKQRNILSTDLEEGYHVQQNTFSMDQLETKELMSLIQTLPNNYRMVFNLYAIEGYSHREIAVQMGITEGASKTQLSRARDILKDKLLKKEGLKYESYAG